MQRFRGPKPFSLSALCKGLGGLNPLVASQMALWSLQGCPNSLLLPPGLSESVSGVSRAVQMALCSLRRAGPPRRSLESPKQSKWLSGASRATHAALVAHLGPPRLTESRCLSATQLARCLPGCPPRQSKMALLLPPGLSASVSGVSQAIQMAVWSLPGRPNSSRGP